MSSVELPGEVVREHYRRQGAEAERERIIKLLETLSHDWDVPARDNSGDMLHVAEFCTACTAIALIKGEQPFGNTEKLGENK